MRSMAHGRNTLGWGKKGGTSPNAGKTAIKYRCTDPEGKQATKRVFAPAPYEQPVALYYQHGGVWHLNTVIDAKNRPDWAKNYTETEAVKI